MLAVVASCAMERDGCANAKATSSAMATILVCLIFSPKCFLTFLFSWPLRLQAQISVSQNHSLKLLQNFDAACQATAYGIGSTTPASRNARNRNMQLSQMPQALVSPE